MNAPLLHPVIKDSLITDAAEPADVYIDLDYWDSHKVATDPRFVVRDGLNGRRW